MLFTTVAALVIPVAIMAAPAQKATAGDDQCTPVTYDLSEYTLSRSPSYNFVSFNIESKYPADSIHDDPVDTGANCEADGADLGSDNQCNIAGVRTSDLMFDVNGGPGDARYRIEHTWKCNNATWVSDTDIALPPLSCNDIEDSASGDTVTCRGDAITFVPQNVRKLAEDDSKKAAGKVKPAAGKPTAKPPVKASAKPTDRPTAKPTAKPTTKP